MLKELDALARKCALHSHMLLFVQNHLTPLNNVIRNLKGMKEQALPPLDVLVNNDDLRVQMTKATQLDLEHHLMLELTHSFLFRDMDKAQLIVDSIEEHIIKRPLVFNYVIIDLFVGLTACYFTRVRDESEYANIMHESENTSQISQALKTCDQLKWMVGHSEWNFENKFLLLQAECQYTQGDIEKAAESYEASIQSAKKHTFINEQALACELAGYFYKEQGDKSRAMSMFKQACVAYTQWGAAGKAKMLRESTGVTVDASSTSLDTVAMAKDEVN